MLGVGLGGWSWRATASRANFDYIDSVGLDPEATRIKMKDIEDNMMNKNRIMGEYGLYQRWAKAYHRLSQLW